MKIVKVETKDGRTFYCKPGTRIRVEAADEVGDWRYVEMSAEEFAAIPATQESAALFE
jgi:hypothetical protein